MRAAAARSKPSPRLNGYAKMEAMQLIVKATQFTLTPALLIYVEDKMNRLSKLLPKNSGLASARIELARATRHHKKGKVYYAEINLNIAGKLLMRAEATHYDVRAAFDAARQEVQTELRRFEDKRVASVRRGARRVKSRIRGTS